jgi:branched-chain amino acid transport system substrate-binding protein
MLKKVLLISLMALVVSGLIFSGCTKPSPAGPTEIVIGGTEPLTGTFGALGQGGQFGLKAAEEDINKQGGIYVADLGRKLPVRYIIVDDESDQNKAGSLAEAMILNDKVSFLLAEEPVPNVAAIATVAERNKVPYVVFPGPDEVFTALRKASTPPWEYTWALTMAIGSPAPAGDFRAGQPGYTMMGLQSDLAKQFVAQTNKKAAIFAIDNSSGRSWYTAFPPALKQLGCDVIGADKELGIAPMGTTDFSSIIQQWKNNNCEILWGSAPAPWFGTMWRQANAMGFNPKLIFASNAANYYDDVKSWGGNLPNGICCELVWFPSYKDVPGIGNTTPQSLYDRWFKATNQPLNQNIGLGYATAQVLFAAIEKAGSLDKEKVNKTIAGIDMPTMASRVLFNQETHTSRIPIALGQWQKSNKPYVWEDEVIVSPHSFLPTTAKPIFPIQY